MKRLVDAFDYTRSEEAALRGLRSVAGTGNVLPRLMQFDSSRRHLSALRQQMEMPVCKYAWKGALNRTNNVWMSYTGACDNLSGDSNMGDYSRNAQGAIVGVDRSLSCKLRVGLSLGYETSTGKADDSKVDADTFFVDAYATGVTGHLKHRASVGLAASSFEYDRNVLVEAGYHTFNGLIKGETAGITLNFGYELSSDYHFSERSRMNRYLAVNLAWHQLDSVKEDGMGNVGLTTEFEDEWQADLALGVNYIREFAALRNQKLASFYANAAVHLELLNDRVTATNRLGDSGAGWQTSSMERSPLYFELGAGVVVPLSPTWTGTAGATFEIGPDRYGFSGGVGARYSF
jgi:outer membrane autotransporter protein